VSKKIVLLSAQEALGDEYQAKFWWQHIAIKTVAASAIFTAVIFGTYYLGHFYGEGVSTEVTANLPETKILQSSNIPESPAEKNADKNIEEKMATVANNNIADVAIEAPSKEFVIKGDADNKHAVELSATKLLSQEEATDTNAKVAEANKPKAATKFSVTAVEGVSDDLLSRFQNAIDDIEQESPVESEVQNDEVDEVNVPTLADMPTWLQNDLPSLSFEQHIYTSDGESWVKVNGRERYEGDKITDKLVLNNIYAQKVILTFKGEQFSMPALATW